MWIARQESTLGHVDCRVLQAVISGWVFSAAPESVFVSTACADHKYIAKSVSGCACALAIPRMPRVLQRRFPRLVHSREEDDWHSTTEQISRLESLLLVCDPRRAAPRGRHRYETRSSERRPMEAAHGH